MKMDVEMEVGMEMAMEMERSWNGAELKVAAVAGAMAGARAGQEQERSKNGGVSNAQRCFARLCSAPSWSARQRPQIREQIKTLR